MTTEVKIVEPNDISAQSGRLSEPLFGSSFRHRGDTISAQNSSTSILETDSLLVDRDRYNVDKSTEDFVGKKLPDTLYQSDGIFLLLLVCFLLFTHMYQGGISYLKENFALVFSATKTEKLVESQKTSGEIFYSYFLVFLAILLISISVYEGLDRITFSSASVEHVRKPFLTIGAFVILISAFVFLKLAFYHFLGYIFDLGKKSTTWNQSYIFLLGVSGALCFLPTLLLVYSEIWHIIIIVFSLVLFLVVQLLLIVRILVFFFQEKYNILFLLAYFCSVEILPYVYLGFGLVYIYQHDILIHI